uniref:GPI transamidase component PIG-S n=1 Tax=Haemonchus contortus TaxID=6289 RepID=A0A7I4YKM2_HAECO
MNGLLCKIKTLLGFGHPELKPGEEKPPKNMNEVIERLPEDFKKYMQEERPYRRAAALAFIIIVFGLGGPLWYYSTRTYRAHFDTFPEEQTISLSVQIHLAVTNKTPESELGPLEQVILHHLQDGEVKSPLNIQWNILNEGLRDIHSLENDRIMSSESLEVYIAVVSPEQWTQFSAINVFLGRGRWAFVQYTSEKEKLLERLHTLIWEVMVDVPHLNAIVKRDMRERMEPWQIAALSPSHQKRLVWDSVPLSMNYIVQVIHVHDNASPETFRPSNIMEVIGVFAKRLRNVTKIQLSSEHLWDFEISNFFETDVQGRYTLTQGGMERLLKEVDSQLLSVESSLPVLKMIIIEVDVPVVMLDPTGEDSHGAAVASWGAVVPRIGLGETEESAQPGARVLGALRVLLGVDSDLPSTWKRSSVPLAVWEVDRMRLRAILDNSMRAISAVKALKALTVKITNVVISDDVAARATQAVRLVTEGLTNPKAPQLKKISAGRQLADEALHDPSLLAMLYFPKDQTMAVYLPIMLPTLIPLFGSIIALCKWALGWS